MAAIIQQLLDYSRRRGGTPAMASLQHLVTRTVDLLSAAAQRGRVDVRCNAVGDATLAAVDQNQIQQALTNIVLNGIQAMPQGGELHIDVGVRRVRPPAGRGRGEGEYAYVHVADSGMGIPPEQLPHIFEPFFTTKRAGEGTGLGLAVADGILAEHGGWIAAESTPGEGSSFYLFLPRAAAGAAAA
jgi:signal transduction histidine kinase